MHSYYVSQCHSYSILFLMFILLVHASFSPITHIGFVWCVAITQQRAKILHTYQFAKMHDLKWCNMILSSMHAVARVCYSSQNVNSAHR